MHLFPAIDIRNGQVVRLTQGDYDRQTTYQADPVDQAKLFRDAGATWLHMVDLDGARTGKLTHAKLFEQVCTQTGLKVEIGGGVRSESVIDTLLNAGVTRVVVGTAALKNWAWFEALMGNPTYRGRLVLGLDAKQGKVTTDGWEQTSELTALDIAKQVTDWPLAAIVYTDIATDGTLKGPNIQATREIAEATDVPIVASGGVGSLEDLRALRELPIQGAIVGKAIYEKAFTIDEAIKAFEK